MPLTKEQASQIDWEALLTRLAALAAKLRLIEARHIGGPPLLDPDTHALLNDCATTLTTIEQATSQPEEVTSDATTP